MSTRSTSVSRLSTIVVLSCPPLPHRTPWAETARRPAEPEWTGSPGDRQDSPLNRESSTLDPVQLDAIAYDSAGLGAIPAQLRAKHASSVEVPSSATRTIRRLASTVRDAMIPYPSPSGRPVVGGDGRRRRTGSLRHVGVGKSCPLICPGCPVGCRSRPLLACSPTSSFFLVTALITGSPAFRNSPAVEQAQLRDARHPTPEPNPPAQRSPGSHSHPREPWSDTPPTAAPPRRSPGPPTRPAPPTPTAAAARSNAAVPRRGPQPDAAQSLTTTNYQRVDHDHRPRQSTGGPGATGEPGSV
jgi:hypothetical protein